MPDHGRRTFFKALAGAPFLPAAALRVRGKTVTLTPHDVLREGFTVSVKAEGTWVDMHLRSNFELELGNRLVVDLSGYVAIGRIDGRVEALEIDDSRSMYPDRRPATFRDGVPFRPTKVTVRVA